MTQLTQEALGLADVIREYMHEINLYDMVMKTTEDGTFWSDTVLMCGGETPQATIINTLGHFLMKTTEMIANDNWKLFGGKPEAALLRGMGPLFVALLDSSGLGDSSA